MHFLNNIVQPGTYCEITREGDGYRLNYTTGPMGKKLLSLTATKVAYAANKLHVSASVEYFTTATAELKAFAKEAAGRIIAQYHTSFEDPRIVEVIFMREQEACTS